MSNDKNTMKIEINITGLDPITKAIDNLSLSLLNMKFPRSVSVITGTATEAPEAPAKKKVAKKKVATEIPVEVIDTTRTEEEVMTQAKALVAKFSPTELRAILDDTVGAGVKISTAPAAKYARIYDALVAKLLEGGE
tara:strand:+ start:391 stop:801 length:411 start_codon:yes stop_codon:yes gene_type:complete